MSKGKRSGLQQMQVEQRQYGKTPGEKGEQRQNDEGGEGG
jgi:hypothetical protein